MYRRVTRLALALLGACSSTDRVDSGSVAPPDAGGTSDAPTSTPTEHAGDPCRSAVFQREGGTSSVYQPKSQLGDIAWIETPAITHDRDYFAYGPFVKSGVPTNWRTPVDLTEGQIWLRVEVIETPPAAEFPIYYTVTFQPGRADAIKGFLRAAVAIDKPGPATYDAVADVRQLEFSPDGSCCQNVCGQPWPWDAAWESIAGDVVVLKGTGFPLKVKTTIVLRPPR